MPVITGGSTPVTFTVEVCFNQDPNDPAAPTAVWTDITQRCSNIRWSRGRQYELDKVEAGTFSATVDNLDGALTPGNTASAFFPNVVLYRQIRVKALLASTTYYLFTGYVSRWPQAYTAAGQRASTAIEAVDTLGVLAQVNLQGWANDALLAYNPTVVYPLDDGATATLFNASVGAVQPGFPTPDASPFVVPGTNFDATMPGFAGRSYVALTNTIGASTGGLVTLPAGAVPTSGAWTFSVWFQTSSGGSFPNLLSLGAYGQQSIVQVFLNTGGFPFINVYDSTSQVSATASLSPSVSDGQWHLLSVCISADHKTIRTVLDASAPQTIASGATVFTLADLGAVTLGGPPPSYGKTASTTFTTTYLVGGVAEVVVFPTDLASDVTNPLQTVLYPAAKAAFVGERTDQRAQRIAASTGFGTRFVATANGDSLMSAGSTSGQTAADAMADVATTESGMIFARGDGMLVFTPRHARYNPAPVYNFGELELPYSALAFDYDPTHLVNSATVSRPGGSSTTVTDAASVKANFTHSQAYTLQLSSDFAVRAAAEWIVSRYKNPKIRVSSFTVNPLANSDLVSAVLNAELGTCVQVTRRPPGVQAITQTCFMDRLEHQLAFDASGGSWTVNYMLTPADTTSYLVWDAPNPYGNWDKNNWAY